MKVRELIKMIEKDGWFPVRSRGSHRQYHHEVKTGTVTVSGKESIDTPMRYMIVLEKSETSWGAYVPDLPGCVAVAETEDEVKQLIQEAIEFHLEDLQNSGAIIPRPMSKSEYVEVARQ